MQEKSLEKIIQQAENLSDNQQRQLASYFVLKYLHPDNDKLIQLLYLGNDFELSKNIKTGIEKNKSFKVSDFKGILTGKNIDIENELQNMRKEWTKNI